MFHACVQRFDVMDEKFLDGELRESFMFEWMSPANQQTAANNFVALLQLYVTKAGSLNSDVKLWRFYIWLRNFLQNDYFSIFV
jgi:hypothetical protein